MANKVRKHTRVLDLVKEQAAEIEKDYEAGVSPKELATKFGCSNNTMMITLGVLGYEHEPWAKEQVERKLEAIARNKAKRVKKTVGN
jgi:uncharacterized protein YjcR